MKNNYLYIFVHLPKTGGETLIKHVVKNLGADEVILLDNNNLKIYPHSKKKIDYYKIVKKYLLSIPLEKRKKVRFLTGHIVPFGINKFFPTKKVRYITFIRYPLRRILSMFNYYFHLYLNEDSEGRKKRLYRDILLVMAKLHPLVLGININIICRHMLFSRA